MSLLGLAAALASGSSRVASGYLASVLAFAFSCLASFSALRPLRPTLKESEADWAKVSVAAPVRNSASTAELRAWRTGKDFDMGSTCGRCRGWLHAGAAGPGTLAETSFPRPIQPYHKLQKNPNLRPIPR